MEPLSKRPRLSMFREPSSGEELDSARYNNDMILKSRFEHIFRKYGQDFSDVGDEVDLMTGRIIVNRGHLDSIETETDPGNSTSIHGFLQTMTVHGGHGPDEALSSIEILAETALAENVITIEDSSDEDTDDSLFIQSREASQEREQESAMAPYNSDSDSLFDEDHMEDDQVRASSPDSLFEVQQNPIAPPRESVRPSNACSSTDDSILAKFGPEIGKEVLDLIEVRQQAHIEPVWRLPFQIESASVSRPRPIIPATFVARTPISKKRSIWKTTRQQKKRRQSSSSDITVESIDPLQEDESAQQDTENSDDQEEQDEHDEQEEQPGHSDDDFYEFTNKNPLEPEICSFCGAQFANRSCVMAHWDRWLKKSDEQRGPNDPHDVELMSSVRSRVKRRVRDQRLVIDDFRTMIQLHEGADMTFDEIAAEKVLRTRKSGPQLQHVYNQYRTPPAHKDGVIIPWPKEDEETLERACRKPLATVATVRRKLKHRTVLEIGNKLAGIWLANLRSDPNRAVRIKEEQDL